MVYIFECLSGLGSKPDRLEEVRQKLKDQITDGCVLLPADMRLVKVVETDPEPMVITTTPPDDENCTTCASCNLLYNPPVCRINGESLPNPSGRFCNKYKTKSIHTYPGVADDITEEAYDRRDGKR